MNKLRTILAAALLTMPVVALNASTASDALTGVTLETKQQAGCCWAIIAGRWYCIPC